MMSISFYRLQCQARQDYSHVDSNNIEKHECSITHIGMPNG